MSRHNFRATLAVLLLAALPAHAAPEAREVAEAERRMRRGNALYDKGLYEESLRLYVAAYELVPSLDILFNIGLAREKVLDYEGCALAFTQYLASTQQDDPARQRAEERKRRCRERTRIPVRLTSIPPGAAVFLTAAEGEPPVRRGRTPNDLELEPGTYHIGVELPGHLPVSQEVVVEVGKRPEVDFALEKLASLTIEADVAGAQVSLEDGPLEPAPLQRELRAGNYRVRVLKDGHREVQRDVRVAPGEKSTLVVDLPALPVLRTLSIDADANASVFADGRRLGAAPVSLHMPTGRHRIRVTAPDRVPFEREIAVDGTRDIALWIQLEPRRTDRQRAVLWGLGSVASASAIGSAVYGALAYRDDARYHEVPSLALADRGARRAHTSDVLLGTTIAIASAAILYYWLTEPEESRAEER